MGLPAARAAQSMAFWTTANMRRNQKEKRAGNGAGVMVGEANSNCRDMVLVFMGKSIGDPLRHPTS